MPQEMRGVTGNNPRTVALEMSKQLCLHPIFASELAEMLTIRENSNDFKTAKEKLAYIKGIRDGTMLLLVMVAKTGSTIGGKIDNPPDSNG